jgi:hypothetical protein
MFIDADIEFNAMDVLMLAYLDKDIIGAPYPKKCLATEQMVKAVQRGIVGSENHKDIEKFVGDYVFNVVPGTTSFEIDNPVEVMETGTGFMMIDRKVFEPFATAYPELAVRPDHNRTEQFNGSRMIHAYFDTAIDPETKRYLSEDYMFCQWSRKIGFKVWLCPWMELKHTGTYIFGGSLRNLAALNAPPPAPVPETPGASEVAPEPPVEVPTTLLDPPHDSATS